MVKMTKEMVYDHGLNYCEWRDVTEVLKNLVEERQILHGEEKEYRGEMYVYLYTLSELGLAERRKINDLFGFPDLNVIEYRKKVKRNNTKNERLESLICQQSYS